MDWITASLWLSILSVIFLLAIRFLLQARKLEPGSVGRHTNIALFIMFIILGGGKLFDLLIVNLGSAPLPIPFLADMFGVAPKDIILGLVVMSAYIIGFSVLLFVLEKHTLNTKYLLTIIPIAIIVIAWILTAVNIPVDLFLEDLYHAGSDAWILLFFFVPRAFIPLAYLYLSIKTAGIYRKKSIALFFGYGALVMFFVRQPLFEFLAPYIIMVSLVLIIWGHKQA